MGVSYIGDAEHNLYFQPSTNLDKISKIAVLNRKKGGGDPTDYISIATFNPTIRFNQGDVIKGTGDPFYIGKAKIDELISALSPKIEENEQEAE